MSFPYGFSADEFYERPKNAKSLNEINYKVKQNSRNCSLRWNCSIFVLEIHFPSNFKLKLILTKVGLLFIEKVFYFPFSLKQFENLILVYLKWL